MIIMENNSPENTLGKLLSFEDEFLSRQAKREKRQKLAEQYQPKDKKAPPVPVDDGTYPVTLAQYRDTMKLVQDTFDTLIREKTEMIKKHNALVESYKDLSERLEMSLEINRMMLLEMHQRHGITLERSGNLFLKHFHGVNTDAQTPGT